MGHRRIELTLKDCDVMAKSDVLAKSHVTAIGTAIGMAIGAVIGNATGGWQSQVIWRSIYSPRSPHRNSSCFYPKRHYFTLGNEDEAHQRPLSLSETSDHCKRYTSAI